MTHLPVSLPSQKTEMSDSTDDEAYDYDETGHGSDDYSDDFGDETDDDANSGESPSGASRVTNPASPADAAPTPPSAVLGASLATGTDVTNAASSAAAATARFQAAAVVAPATAAPVATSTAESTGASEPAEGATRALRALNLMATGVVSSTDALLFGHATDAAFADRVRQIAAGQPQTVRPSLTATANMIEQLTPLMRSLNKPTESSDGTGGDGGMVLPAPPARRAPATVGAVVQAAAMAQPDPEPDAKDKDAVMAHKLQGLRVNLLRIATRLGQSPRNTVVAQVIYRLELAEQLKSGKKAAPAPGTGTGRGNASTFDRAVALAESAEQREGTSSDLGFTCTILLLGKSGVGKSSTINSLLGGADSVAANAFKTETTKVRVVTHKMHGMTLRLIDTPGLQPSSADIAYNARVMADAKRFTKKHKPDIVLYFDRMDQVSRVDGGDLPLLKTITSAFGAAVWFNAIVVLTHGSSAPPDGQNGQPISYEMYFAQRSHLVQQTIQQAAGDARLMNPVALAENHPLCRTNRDGDRVLPNGQVWIPQLLLLCFASKILTEANGLLNLQEQNAKAAKAAAQQQKVPPLPFLLSSLITSRKPRKLMGGGDDDEYDDASDVVLGAPSPYDVPKVRVAFPKSATHCFVSQLVTVQTDFGDCCPYIVQYTRYTTLTLCLFGIRINRNPTSLRNKSRYRPPTQPSPPPSTAPATRTGTGSWNPRASGWSGRSWRRTGGTTKAGWRGSALIRCVIAFPKS